jgi:hypothetical protein
MDQYNESLSMDRVFYVQDIRGSIAYARANVKTGILTQEEFEVIERGLKDVSKEWEEGKFKPAPGDEGKQASLPTYTIYTSPLLLVALLYGDQLLSRKRYSYCERAPPWRNYRHQHSRKAAYGPQS